MRKLFAVGLALAAALALAQTATFVVETQALTRAAPTLPTEGMALKSLQGFRVSVCATSGQTLSGAGSLQAYAYVPTSQSTPSGSNLWMRNPSLDMPISVSGVRCQVFPDMQTVRSNGRVLFAATGVTVSGGTTVNVAIEGQPE